MKTPIDRPWFRAGVDGAEILTWEGWLAFGVAGGGTAAIWRATTPLPAFQQFGLVTIFLLLAGFLMRFRSVDPTDESANAHEPWTYWAPIVVAIGFIIAFNLFPNLGESERMALTAAAMVPTALVKFAIERWEAGR